MDFIISLFHMINPFFQKHKYYFISFSTSVIFLMTTIQQYHRLRNEYDHYHRRYRMLQSITIQKRDEFEHLMNHIYQLLLVDDQMNISIQPKKKLEVGQCFSGYDCGDHSLLIPVETLCLNQNKESDDDDDPLLERLKQTRPSRLKTSSQQLLNNSVHTVYSEYLSE